MAAPKNEKVSNVPTAVYLSITKLTDSGLGIFVIIAFGIIGLAWVLTRGLESKDRLTFLTHLADNRVLAWGGWVVAGIIFYVARWVLKKEREWNARELARADAVKEKALSQGTLDLQQTKTDKN